MIPWSYSFLNDLANCPFKAYRKYVKHDLPKEDSPELREGITTHKRLETYINGAKLPYHRLPVELEQHALPMVRAGAKAEVKLGMTIDFKRMDFFAHADLWGRGKADVLIIDPPVAMIFDWKTGKVREDDRELRCLSMLVRANYPEITSVSGAYVWLKEGRMGAVYDLTDVNRTYHATVAAVDEAQSYEDEGTWPCKPNALCSWCPVFDCKFNSNPRLDISDKPAMIAP